MRRGRSTTIDRLWGMCALVLVTLLPDRCLPAPARQITPTVEETRPLVTPDADSRQPALPEKRTAKVPILVYHHVSQSDPEGSHALRRLTVTADIFAQQMQYLQDNGYHVITFSDVADYFDHGKELPTLPVIISFDDGWGNAVRICATDSGEISLYSNVLCGHRLYRSSWLHLLAPVAHTANGGHDNRQPHTF